jgi:hypothetical protein
VSASERIFALVPGILLAVGYAGKMIEQSIAAIALGLVYGAARVWHLEGEGMASRKTASVGMDPAEGETARGSTESLQQDSRGYLKMNKYPVFSGKRELQRPSYARQDFVIRLLRADFPGMTGARRR